MAQKGKNMPAMRETQFNPWVRMIPWRREWQPTSGFLPGKSHLQRRLADYSIVWGCRESDTTEQLTLSLSFAAICKKERSYLSENKCEIQTIMVWKLSPGRDETSRRNVLYLATCFPLISLCSSLVKCLRAQFLSPSAPLQEEVAPHEAERESILNKWQ